MFKYLNLILPTRRGVVLFLLQGLGHGLVYGQEAVTPQPKASPSSLGTGNGAQKLTGQEVEQNEGSLLFAPEEDEFSDPLGAADPKPAFGKGSQSTSSEPLEKGAKKAPTYQSPANKPLDKTSQEKPVSGQPPTGSGSKGASSAAGSDLIQKKMTPKTSENESVFGTYRIRIGGARPTFSDDLRFYKSAYGEPSAFPTFSADWYAFDWYASFGVSLRTGFYTDTGNPIKGAEGRRGVPRDSLTESDVEKDRESNATLTLVPVQTCAIFQFTPFQHKWVVFDGWFGFERLYFQEVRVPTENSAAAQSSKDNKDSILTNNGMKGGFLYGFGLNIRIDQIDETTTQSLKPMGLSGVYLNPFYEVISQTDKGVDFSRRNLGLNFVFESLL